MEDMISRQALCEYALNQKDKSITPNDIMRFPSAQPETHDKRTKTHSCDCISRQAAIRIVDGVDTWQAGWRGDAIESMKALPSAQPEIVRCKDCKHQVKEWRTDKRLKNKGYMVCGCDVVGDACGYWALLGQDDDFCSMAKRRTDGN